MPWLHPWLFVLWQHPNFNPPFYPIWPTVLWLHLGLCVRWQRPKFNPSFHPICLSSFSFFEGVTSAFVYSYLFDYLSLVFLSPFFFYRIFFSYFFLCYFFFLFILVNIRFPPLPVSCVCSQRKNPVVRRLFMVSSSLVQLFVCKFAPGRRGREWMDGPVNVRYIPCIL